MYDRSTGNAALAEARAASSAIATARLQAASALAAVDDAIGGIGASSSPTVVAKGATYSETATSGEHIILASGTFTINLPTALGNTAKFTVKLITAGAVTIDPAGTQTIDGGATAVVNVQYTAISFVSDGANWVII